MFVGKSFRIDIGSDLGSFSGTLACEPYELLIPVLIPEESFVSMKQRLSGGFTETTREVPVKVGSSFNDISQAIRRLLNVSEVASKDRENRKFHAVYRRGKSEDTVSISCRLKDSVAVDIVTLTINCSDAVLCATLVDFVKKYLNSCLASLS